jgi:DNA polymerase-3 subunit delta
LAGQGDFERHLKAGALLPVYVLVGAESVLVYEATTLLRRQALPAAADFNRHELTAGETPIDRALEAARTLPMMAPRRFVHISSIEVLKAKDHAPLLAYLEQPAAHTVLCLSGSKLDQRTKLGQRAAQSGGLFVFEVPRQQELAAWIEHRARRQGFQLTFEAAQLLGDLIGVEVGSLDRAVEKVALYAGADVAITAEHVEAAVAPTRVHSIFELTAAIGARNLGLASSLLRNALGGGESALGVLGMITRQFRQLLQVKALGARRASNKEIAATTGIRPFLVDSLQAQARHYTTDELTFALDAALQADIRLKSSGLAPGVALDRLLIAVMGHGRP